jgi:hypothetical protein
MQAVGVAQDSASNSTGPSSNPVEVSLALGAAQQAARRLANVAASVKLGLSGPASLLSWMLCVLDFRIGGDYPHAPRRQHALFEPINTVEELLASIPRKEPVQLGALTATSIPVALINLVIELHARAICYGVLPVYIVVADLVPEIGLGEMWRDFAALGEVLERCLDTGPQPTLREVWGQFYSRFGAHPPVRCRVTDIGERWEVAYQQLHDSPEFWNALRAVKFGGLWQSTLQLLSFDEKHAWQTMEIEFAQATRMMDSNTPPASEERQHEGQSIFVLETKMWHLRFVTNEGGIEDGYFPDLRGFAHYHQLLAREGRDVKGIELVGGTALEGSDQPTLGDQGMRECRQKLAEYYELIEKAERSCNPGEAKVLQEELDALLKSLKKDTFKGRARTLGYSPEERARKTAGKNMRKALKLVSQKMPALAEHLKKSVLPNGSCFAYRPTSPRPNWDLSEAGK